MPWEQNERKREMLARCGVTAGLPLFANIETPVGDDSNHRPSVGEGRRTMPEMPSRVFNAKEFSAQALEKIKSKLPESRLVVFLAICKLGSATDREIAHYTEVDINCVCGRRFELKESGLIQYAGSKIGEKGLPNSLWAVNPKKLNEMLE